MEMARDMTGICPEILLTRTPESADYVISFHRTGSSAGFLTIYSGNAAVYSFKPGHSATLKKVAEKVCAFMAGAPPR